MADGSHRAAPPVHGEWTTGELARLASAYPAGGIQAARQALPGRTDRAIRQKARLLKLRSPVAPINPARIELIQRLDADIRATYAAGLKWGDIKGICDRHKVGRHTVYSRVRAIGLPVVQIKEKPWSDAELDLLDTTAHLGVPAAYKRFKAAGYSRSPGAIQIKRHRLAMCIRTAKDDRGLRTTTEIAELLGVTDQTVRVWLRQGLRAELRGPVEAVGHYLIKETDLRRWIIDHPLRVNLARIPVAAHPWFITMLSGMGE